MGTLFSTQANSVLGNHSVSRGAVQPSDASATTGPPARLPAMAPRESTASAPMIGGTIATKKIDETCH